MNPIPANRGEPPCISGRIGAGSGGSIEDPPVLEILHQLELHLRVLREWLGGANDQCEQITADNPGSGDPRETGKSFDQCYSEQLNC